MKLEKRTEKGAKVRSFKVTPGVLYGNGFDSVSVQGDAKDVLKQYHAMGTSKTFEIKLDKKTHIVYFKEVQILHEMPNVLSHFDLVKVSKDDTMTSSVRVELLNQDVIEKKGLSLNLMHDHIEISYPVGSGVSSLKLDVGELGENDSLTVGDIELPEGITVLDNLEDTVVSVYMRKEIDLDEEMEETEEEVVEVEYIKQKSE